MFRLKNYKVKTVLTCALLLATGLSFAQPSFDMSFTPDTIGLNSTSQLTYSISNGANVAATDLGFSNNLPSGVSIAVPNNASTSCGGGVISATDGDSVISLSDGLVLPGTVCEVVVNVTANAAGTFDNTTGDLTSSLGNSGTATDQLTVNLDRPGFSQSFSPVSVGLGERSNLTYVIDNTLNVNTMSNLTFTNQLPSGIQVADPANFNNNCNGGVITAVPGSEVVSYTPAFFGDATLAAGALCSISVDVKGVAIGEFINTSSDLTGSSQFVQVNSGFSASQITVDNSGDLILRQDFINDAVAPGSLLMLEFTLNNFNRNDAATGIGFSTDLNATLAGLSAVDLPSDPCGMGSTLTGPTNLVLSGGNLPAEGSCTFTVELQVPANAVGGEYISTTSAVTSNESFGDASTESLFVNFAPTISQIFLNNPIGAGATTSLEFTLTNTSATSPASEINFENNLAQFISGVVASNLPAPGFCGAGSQAFVGQSNGEDTLFIISGNLPAAGSCTFVVDLIVPINTPNGTYLSQTSAINATIDGVVQTGETASDVLTVLKGPDLSVEFTNDPVSAGELVNARINLNLDENSLNEATALSFTWDLDATLSGLTAVGLPINDVCGVGSNISGSGNLTFSGGSLQPGANCTFDISLQVPAAANPGNFISTTSALNATIAGVPTLSSAGQDELIVGGVVFKHEFLEGSVIAGESLTLEYTIENNLTTDAITGTFFTHNLTPILNGLVSTSGTLTDICGVGSSLTGTNFLIFTGGNLPPNASCTFQLTLQTPASANDGAFSSLTSTLSATIGNASVVLPPSNNTLMINSELIDFNMMFLDGPFSPGDVVSLQYSLENLSDSETLTGLTFNHGLVNTLVGLAATGTPISDVCGDGSTLSGTEQLLLAGGSLAAGERCEFTVALQLPMAVNGGNFSSVTSDVGGILGGLNVFGSAANADLQVFPVQMSFSFENPTDAGRATRVNYLIENSSNQDFSGFRFSHALNVLTPGYELVGALPMNPCGESSSLIAAGTLNLENGSLIANSSCQFSIEVRLSESQTFGVFESVINGVVAAGEVISPSAFADLNVSGELAVRAARVADYWFDNTLSSEVLGAPDLVYTGTLNYLSENVAGRTKTVLPFIEGEGLSLDVSQLLMEDEYTLAMLLKIDDSSGYVKLIDFDNLSSDDGLYNFDTALNFFDISGAIGPVNPVVDEGYYQVILTRKGTGELSGFINGVQQFSITDNSNQAVVNSEAMLLRFMIDDIISEGVENSAGSMARITLFDVPFEQNEVDLFPSLGDIIFFNGFD